MQAMRRTQERSLYLILSVFVFAIGMFVCKGNTTAAAEVAEPSAQHADLTSLSFEDLANVQVTSVSKKQQKLSDTAAAVYVISQEDIRRSGATSLPELFRMVPGIAVAHIDSNKWAVSARGFNERFAKMMLVMIDGRSVYTPLFSGVEWDVQDTLLADIDRIEVIRGPGATMWGANAVNGVINIITKSARDTHGSLFTTTYGTEEQPLAAYRVGGSMGSNASYRVFAKGFNRDGFLDANANESNDAWGQLRGGFRMDWGETEGRSTTVQGDIYRGREEEDILFPILEPPFTDLESGVAHVSGGNILARWNWNNVGKSDSSLQAYYDRTKRSGLVWGETRQVFDVDYQSRFAPAKRHEVVWGLDYRYSPDELRGSQIITPIGDCKAYSLFSMFAQDDISLSNGKACLTVGSKLERNNYTGWEIQPNVRYLRHLNENNALWAAVSRAVRTPACGERDLRIRFATFPDQAGPTDEIAMFGNMNLKSEELLAYESGYRSQIGSRCSLDASVFYNVYDRLRSSTQGTPFPEVTPPFHIVIPLLLDNGASGHTEGLELAAKWHVTDRWMLSSGYTLFADHITGSAGGSGDSPRNQFNLRSTLDLPHGQEFDAAAYYVQSLSFAQVGGAPVTVDGYVRVDMRYGWRPTDSLELSLGVRNLLQDHHLEFQPILGETATEVPRSVYARATVRF